MFSMVSPDTLSSRFTLIPLFTKSSLFILISSNHFTLQPLHSSFHFFLHPNQSSHKKKIIIIITSPIILTSFLPGHIICSCYATFHVYFFNSFNVIRRTMLLLIIFSNKLCDLVVQHLYFIAKYCKSLLSSSDS